MSRAHSRLMATEALLVFLARAAPSSAKHVDGVQRDAVEAQSGVAAGVEHGFSSARDAAPAVHAHRRPGDDVLNQFNRLFRAGAGGVMGSRRRASVGAAGSGLPLAPHEVHRTFFIAGR